MQTRPFCSGTNSDIIKQHSRIAIRADETRVGYVFALIDGGQTAIVHHDYEHDMVFYPIIDLIPMATVTNDPAHYTGTLL